MHSTSISICFAVLVSFVVAQEPEYPPCVLSPSLQASKANWDGAQIGLSECGRLCVADQNCYNCGSPCLLSSTCLCAKQSFYNDVVGCINGSGSYCAGQAAIFIAYHTRVCVNNGAPASMGSAPVSPAPAVTTAAVIPATTLIATTVRVNTTTANATTVPRTTNAVTTLASTTPQAAGQSPAAQKPSAGFFVSANVFLSSVIAVFVVVFA
ncbi:hypothetical protein HK098_002712 [Nowakowskiella sp. JEL0407]|nr:hypothetical protein HK098_002712 [Nowakowskiella sp. JEL0407]